MFWKSKGLIFNSSEKVKHIKSHSWVPTPIKLKDGIYKIFYAGRDRFNHSNIYSFDYSFKNHRVVHFSQKPHLKKGRLGCFDDCAVIPSHVISYKKKFYLYYIGWTQGKSVPYLSALGLATSKSLNSSFKKFSEAPIFGRTKDEPIFTASCFVRKNKNFEMWYTSNKSWKKKRNNFIPRYNIKFATSKNGVDWFTRDDAIKFKSRKETAITRPWIINLKKKTIMFYSYRGQSYRIGYAIKYKKKWIRKDKYLKFNNSVSKFDSNMREYGAVISYKEKLFMFYNGNNFGEDGVGLAEYIE